MAISSSPINTSSDTFGTWIDKTNSLIDKMSTVIVTTEASSTGGQTTGNAHVQGILSGSTLVAGTALRGGTVDTAGTLTITSNTAISPSTTSTFTTNASTNVTMSGNVTISGATKTLNVSTVTTNIAGTTTNLNSTTINVNALSTMNVNGNANFNGVTTIDEGEAELFTTNNAVVDTSMVVNGSVHFNSIYGIELPTGTTAQRPLTPETGSLRYNTTYDGVECSDSNGDWVRLSGAYVTDTTPSDGEAEGALWFDTGAGGLRVRNGTSWTFASPVTSDGVSAALGMDLNVTGNVEVDGLIYATGDITAFSDIRLKENVLTIDSALDKITAMRGVYYNRIGEADRKIGVIAQEVEKIAPELVLTQDNGLKAVAYANALGLIIEAIKELKADIEELKRG